ncbi:two-component system response regulator [Neoasaia chiangmaiensis NBRC 101099]|uniref:Transcriptional regulator n=1 Tax=Neoasaia chiangmaiensis TaxID=320497 RepID=A0A1U9KRT1_9PROT|nr:response regulator [Neoasaia chiangmaiensis]AQS88462.1 transcriptional regulator [Neoasaia chiangmaiensis]GBR36643.1 two-component system response regulator [Neoasaia chiangmaiensis NBRC 101099]GEN15278.1 sigma-54-dependent Fis family transcriptional regulator [Neoasaia chiangmaiensis]
MSQPDAKPLLLFVDDDPDIQSAARLLFRHRRLEIVCANDAQSALTQLATHAVDLVLLDLNYSRGATSGAEGLTLLKDMLVLRPELPVVVVTGHSGVTIAVEAMRAGARDFVMKPWHNDRLATLIEKLLAGRTTGRETAGEPAMIVASAALGRIVGEADRLAPTRAPIVICGPPGSGKTLLARRILALSRDAGSETLIRAEECDTLPEEHGNWLIRDVETLTPTIQRRLADSLERVNPPRVIAVSSLDRNVLEARLDPRLMLHLGMVVLTIPPLDRRPDDIVALVTHFSHYFATRHGLPEPDVDDVCLASLKAAVWPQNVRSLRATVERAVLTGTWHVPSCERHGSADGPATLHDTERMLVETALRKHGFNVTQAARELGLTRPALYRRMARYGL